MEESRLGLIAQTAMAALVVAVFPAPLNACKCVAKTPVCEAVIHSDVVFAGRVESVEPDFNTWGFFGLGRKGNQLSAPEIKELEDDSSITATRLKELYSKIVPERYRASLSRASTKREVEGIWTAVLSQGKRMRLRVQEVYKGPKAATIDVWTDFSDCAAYLLNGESYLVYADRNRQGRLETTACSRTRRLTDAGEDLAYLHFLRHGGASGRLYGFVTSNEGDLKIPRLWLDLPNPVAGVVL